MDQCKWGCCPGCSLQASLCSAKWGYPPVLRRVTSGLSCQFHHLLSCKTVDKWKQTIQHPQPDKDFQTEHWFIPLCHMYFQILDLWNAFLVLCLKITFYWILLKVLWLNIALPCFTASHFILSPLSEATVFTFFGFFLVLKKIFICLLSFDSLILNII